jgi:dipeptidyl aminopeptidase/acylaminoacyl peptidase
MSSTVTGLAWLLVLSSCVGAYAAEQNPGRRFAIDDMFELEGFGVLYGGPVALSADGRAIAFTRLRPKKTLQDVQQAYLWGNARGDVWVQEEAGKPAFRITNGEQEAAGYWAPEWSPDQRRLVLLSSRGGNVTPWIWERRSRQLRQLTTRAVEQSSIHIRPYRWIDASRLLTSLLPEGEKPAGMRLHEAPRIAVAEWASAHRGVEATASALYSGGTDESRTAPHAELVLIDVRTGTSTTVSKEPHRGARIAPSLQSIAYCRDLGVYRPKADERIPAAASLRIACTVEIRSLAGVDLADDTSFPKDVIAESLSWSPDSRQLAFIAYEGRRDDPPTLFQFELRSKRLVRIPITGIDATSALVSVAAPRLYWADSGHLIVQAMEREVGTRRTEGARRDWWRVGADVAPKNLTRRFKVPPRDLWPEKERRAFVGLADGDIWRIDPRRGTSENLTSGFDPPIEQISWPRYDYAGNQEYPTAHFDFSRVVFSVRADRGLRQYRLRLADKQTVPLAQPAADAFVGAYSPTSDTVVLMQEESPNGLYLWRLVAGASEHETVIESNVFLQDIAESKFRSIEYTSLDGERLKAWLLLPYNYQAGRRYPLITQVYAGAVQRATPPDSATIATVLSVNQQIPAAYGYAVLFPSMPLNPAGDVDDPMLRLPNGVLPAVDEVVRQGFIDSERVVVMGQSFGGYSTYGLITQTHRFKAAVATAGLADLISLYGTFAPHYRYTDTPHEQLFPLTFMESEEMGSPPWSDLGRYLRNSPIQYVHRVQTPLFIAQGDMDFIPLQQGEQFFTSLYRQGKRAQFVRYWGEGHVLESPANIRDLWSRVLAWFDEFTDVFRDGQGKLVFDGARVRSRAGAPPLTPEDFARFGCAEGPVERRSPACASLHVADEVPVR